MTQWTRWLLVVGLVGCGAPAEENADTNDEADADTDADADADTDADTDTDTEAPPAPQWKGNWRIEVAWSWDCDMGFGNMKSDSGEDTWTLNLSGPADSLEATVNDNDWYSMSGYGDDEALTLCGAFPMYDVSHDPAPSGNENQICIDVDTILDAEMTTGIMSGSFMGGYGEDCELRDSPFTLSK